MVNSPHRDLTRNSVVVNLRQPMVQTSHQTMLVSLQIRNAAVDYEMQEEDYYQLQLEQWTKFYSCCIQYHEVYEGRSESSNNCPIIQLIFIAK